MGYIKIIFLFIISLFFFPEAHSQTKNKSPFSFNSLITVDGVDVISGGIKTGIVGLGDISEKVFFDTQKAGLWKGGTFSLYGIYDFGKKPTADNVGCIQTFDNIETYDKLQLLEFWYKQQFKENLYIIIGQSNINADFFHSISGSNMINSNFNTQPDIAANIHVPVFSKATQGIKARWGITKQLAFKGCLYNGYEGTPADNPYNVKFFYNLKKYGFLYMNELSYHFIKDSIATFRIKAGAWIHTGEYLSPVDSTIHAARGGFYLMGEKIIMPKSNAKTQGLGAFFMTGFVPYKNVLTHLFGAIGVNYSGIFNVKIPDIVSIGFTSQQLNNLYFEIYRTTTTKNETIIELNYIYTLNKHFNIQPDLQYLIHPGASRSITDCLLGILRFEISF